MEKIANILIVVGAIFWLSAVIFLGGRWQLQLVSAGIITAGIVTAHVWEELYQENREE